MDLGWVGDVTGVINLLVLIVSLGVEVWAFVHCARQRSDAFSAVGTLSKPIWMAIIGGSALLALFFYSLGLVFAMIAVTAALVYLLDVRPAIREITNGGGRW